MPRNARPDPVRRRETELELGRAEARYHRDRLALYRARVLSSKPTSPKRLRELRETSAAADARLNRLEGR